MKIKSYNRFYAITFLLDYIFGYLFNICSSTVQYISGGQLD